MSAPPTTSVIRRRPWPLLIVSTVIAVAASLIRDVIHEPGTIHAGEYVAIAVTVAAGLCAIWAIVVLYRRRRADSRET